MKLAATSAARASSNRAARKGIGRSTILLPLLFLLLNQLAALGCAPFRRGRPGPLAPAGPTAGGGARPARGDLDALRRHVRDLTLDQLGAPYRYGGKSPRGFDCSGLVWYVFRDVGIRLPRTALDQSRSGRKIDLDELRVGDLIFFRMERDVVSHVAIYVGDGSFVHAPGTGKFVRRDALANDWWRTRIKTVRRVILPPR